MSVSLHVEGCRAGLFKKIDWSKEIRSSIKGADILQHSPSLSGNRVINIRRINGLDRIEVDQCGFSHTLGIQLVENVPELKPVAEPWTFETMPVNVKVKSKYSFRKYIAWPMSDGLLILQSNMPDCEISYQRLLSDYTQLDGSPCGTIKTPA